MLPRHNWLEGFPIRAQIRNSFSVQEGSLVDTLARISDLLDVAYELAEAYPELEELRSELFDLKLSLEPEEEEAS